MGAHSLNQIEMTPARPGAERVGSSMEFLVIIQAKNTRILSEGEDGGPSLCSVISVPKEREYGE